MRRAALDLRNNLKNSSYGYINVMRIETSQALAEAFKVLEAPDVKAQFGAESAWDVIELVLWQYFHRSVNASTMNRMAVSGREIIRWLAEPYVLKTNRPDFEALLYRIAEYAEEWISSEEGLRLSRPTPPPRNVYLQGPPPSGQRRDPVFTRASGWMPASAQPAGGDSHIYLPARATEMVPVARERYPRLLVAAGFLPGSRLFLQSPGGTGVCSQVLESRLQRRVHCWGVSQQTIYAGTKEHTICPRVRRVEAITGPRTCRASRWNEYPLESARRLHAFHLVLHRPATGFVRRRPASSATVRRPGRAIRARCR